MDDIICNLRDCGSLDAHWGVCQEDRYISELLYCSELVSLGKEFFRLLILHRIYSQMSDLNIVASRALEGIEVLYCLLIGSVKYELKTQGVQPREEIRGGGR